MDRASPTHLHSHTGLQTIQRDELQGICLPDATCTVSHSHVDSFSKRFLNADCQGQEQEEVSVAHCSFSKGTRPGEADIHEWTREMDQPVNCLFCKHEDLSLDTQNSHKNAEHGDGDMAQ